MALPHNTAEPNRSPMPGRRGAAAPRRQHNWPGTVGAAFALAWLSAFLVLTPLANPSPFRPRGPLMVIVALVGLALFAIVFGLAGLFRKPRRYAWVALAAGIVELCVSYLLVMVQARLLDY